jgi:threonine synthase
MTGERYEADRVHGLSRVGRPLLVRYDLDAAAKARSKRGDRRAADRPVALARIAAGARDRNIVSLGEIETPLVPLPTGRRGRERAGEGRGAAADRIVQGARAGHGGGDGQGAGRHARSRCRPTAMPARRWRPMPRAAGSRRIIFCPDDTPEINVREIAAQGARVYRVNGLIDDCGKIVGEGARGGAGSISRR